ncbi:S-type pyocin domain-containing protein [Pectobacterium carotovorum]|nr:hypothetical protein PEC301877_40150 [Pectobacterium carotovorum subsp. carotovorum]
MKKPAYYKEGVPYDVRGQVITALSGGSTQAPLVTDLGGGKFQFASQGKACYLMSLSVLGSVWVMDRNDGYGVAACFATEDEKRAAVSLLSGLLPAPKYTPELLEAAMRLLGRPDVMALNSGRWGMQFAVAGRGVMLLGEKAVSVLKVAISRAVTLLTASTAGPMVAAASTLLFSAAAGQGSDRVPGRDREAMLALNAKLLSQNGVKIAPGSTSVDLPVRGSLVYRNGQLALELLKTGDGVSKAVRVLVAERDEATGLDRIRVPSVAGEPERTILINPVAPPAKSSSTGNDEPAPVTPKHTGTDITPVESITVTTTPVDDHKGLQDFIYWSPDADGTGVEPVYVVISDPYGETNASSTDSAPEFPNHMTSDGHDNGAEKPSNIKVADDKYLKNNGVDAHQIKKDFLGSKAEIKFYDIYVDKDSGQLWIFIKGGKGEGIPTGEFINN